MQELAEDRELILRVGRGDREAFLLLHQRYRGPLFSFLLRRVGDRAQAEDLCQEVFLGLLRAAGSWEPRAKVSTLIYRIAINQASKATRRPLPEPLEVEREPASSPGPEGEVSMAERAERVRHAIEALDPDQRDALLLSRYQGLSYAEVAEALDVPIGTVRSRLFRAKMALREALRDLLGPEGAPA